MCISVCTLALSGRRRARLRGLFAGWGGAFQIALASGQLTADAMYKPSADKKCVPPAQLGKTMPSCDLRLIVWQKVSQEYWLDFSDA